MEYWCPPSIPPVKLKAQELSRPSQVLAVTSGNLQAYALDNKDGVENQYSVSNASVERIASISGPSRHHPHVLPSSYQRNLHHLNARRQRHKTDHGRGQRPRDPLPRPYLTCEKYLAYKNRQRLDSGKDGAPVWDSITEEAFQDALVEIIPMGRKKMIQHGKPYGRNELIAEYIYQRTGRVRNRKQVSSHIQVLSNLLKDIPEWNAVIKAIDDSNNAHNHEYYEHSIRDMVHGSSHSPRPLDYLSAGGSDGRDLPPPAFTLGSNADHAEKHCVSTLNFVMWVSPPNPAPNQMTDQIHRYTEIQCHDSSSQPALLESTTNWRMSFPHLASIVEHTSLSRCCDVILLDVSFRLMADFPPPACKLGIHLELDFRHPMANMKALRELHDWKWVCATRMYEHGKCFQQTHHHCDQKKQKIEPGKVAPSFESRYWAEKFVDLIEKQRAAEESGNEGAISAANEKSRNFFSSLSAMQELIAYAPHEVPLLDTPSKPPQGKRMAILLWRFSQAQAGQVGITTWQKLVPPPHRNAVNSPSSAQDMAFPPLSMDTMVDDMHNNPSFSIYPESKRQHSEHLQHHFYPTDLPNTNVAIHEGYDVGFRDEELGDFSALYPSYDILASNEDLSHSNFPSLEHFQFDYHQREASFDEHDLARPSTTNFFQSQQSHLPSRQEQVMSGLAMVPQASGMPALSRHDDVVEGQEGQRQPLDDFDRSTHQLLQAQLGQDQTPDHDAEARALQAAFAAASAMNELGAQDYSHLSEPSQQQRQYCHGQDRNGEMSFASRPRLPHYSSYASQQSHHSPIVAHPTVAINEEALEANQPASTTQQHTPNFDACLDNFSTSIPASQCIRSPWE